jgi:hypothetical protein
MRISRIYWTGLCARAPESQPVTVRGDEGILLFLLPVFHP